MATKTLSSVVEFGLLGPFEVRMDGLALAIRSPKHRVLLAALVLRAGQPVSVWDLAEAIWGDAQPANPHRAVQLYVTRLRQLFAGGVPLIRTRADGYEIAVSPDQVDVGRFRRGVTAAARAADEGDLDGEAAALAAALAQWRDDPLMAVPSERLLREVAPGLREQRLQAMERLFAVKLRLGRRVEVIGELSALVLRHPLRERLWAQLVTALNESGRRADALATYDRMRRILAEELGIEPSGELQALHATVLAGHTVDGRLVPRQLPPDAPTFTGRDRELVWLGALLEDLHEHTTMLTVISGTAGVGKTALVNHWARRAADRFLDGQLWVNLRGYGPGQVLKPEQALNQFLRALGMSDAEIPLGLAEQIGLYRSLMDGRRMLIVLDNASDAAQVRPLLPGAPGCLVIVTSRNQLTELVIAEGARPLVLDLLPRDEARQLLASRLGAERTSTETDAVEKIIRLCARLPLALAIVAARAATHPEFGLAALAEELRDAQGGLDVFAGPVSAGSDRTSGVRAAFSSSYHALGAQAALLFRQLGLHPGPDIAVPAAASLAGLPPSQVRRSLLELCDAHLLTEHSPGRYTFHDLLRAYAAELALCHDSVDDRLRTRHRIFDHYLHTAQRTTQLLSPWEPVSTPVAAAHGVLVDDLGDDIGDHQQALAWCHAEHHVLVAVVQQGLEVGFSTHTWALAWTLAEYLYRQGHWYDWAFVLQIGLEATGRHGTRADEARAHRELARAYARLGYLDTAEIHCKLALEHTDRSTDPVGFAFTHRACGLLSEAKGLHQEALRHEQQALDVFEAIGHKTGLARTLNAIGWTYTLIGDHEQALRHCQKALELQQELGDRKGQAATLDSLGHAHNHLGHYHTATVCFRQSLDLFQQIGDRYKETDALTHLGDAHLAAGNIAAARAAWRQSLAILTELGHHATESLRTKLHNLDQ